MATHNNKDGNQTLQEDGNQILLITWTPTFSNNINNSSTDIHFESEKNQI